LSHTWSLSIEAQFYLVWPLVLMLMYRLRLPRPLMAGIVLLAAAASAADRWHMWTDQAHFLPVYLRTDTHADGILLGCLAALACAWGWVGPRAGRRLRIPALAAIGVLVFVCLESETGDVRLYHGPLLSIVAVGCAVLVIAAVLDPGWALHRCWRVGPLRFLGQRSYSLYLWHVPVFVLVAEHLGDRPVWLRLAVGLLPTALVTELSYRRVENRFRHRSATTAGAAVTPKAA
jgi:peptidoglycan/LPS O-acetylase OafA/YrhL